MDLFIGATVWVHGYDLVTRNLRDFERIATLLPSPDADSRLLVIQPD
jgi:predicted nucleic acid-binding protein